MRKLLSTAMVAIALVAMINPLSAGCDWEPDLEVNEFGQCIRLLQIPGQPDEYYCDTLMLNWDCTKPLFHT